MNAYDSVPVQSHRSEGSWALCLLDPWEKLPSVQLSEKQNIDSIGRTARVKGEKKIKKQMMNPFFLAMGRLTTGIQSQEEETSQFEAQREKRGINTYKKMSKSK